MHKRRDNLQKTILIVWFLCSSIVLGIQLLPSPIDNASASQIESKSGNLEPDDSLINLDTILTYMPTEVPHPRNKQ